MLKSEIRSVYAIQPTLLGSKSKSLAVIIPAKVARRLGIERSTILSLKADETTGLITLETWKTIETPAPNGLVPQARVPEAQ